MVTAWEPAGSVSKVSKVSKGWILGSCPTLGSSAGYAGRSTLVVGGEGAIFVLYCRKYFFAVSLIEGRLGRPSYPLDQHFNLRVIKVT